MNRDTMRNVLALSATLTVLFACASAIAQSPTVLSPSDPILQAVSSGNIVALRQYFNGGGHVDSRDENGATLLLYAVANDRRAVVSFLLERKANINATKRDGTSALHVAAKLGRLDIARH